MAKVETNPVTRRQKLLGAIAGDNTAPAPITETERLLYNIAEKVNEGGGGANPLPPVSATSAKRFLRVGSDGETLEWADADGNTLPVVTVVLHYSYGPSGSKYWYTKDGSGAVLTYDELKALIDSERRGEIRLICINDYYADYIYSSLRETYHTSEPSGYAIMWSRRIAESPNSLYQTLWMRDTDQFMEDNYNVGGQLVVTLTPTAEDFSGTMNKTVSEINKAYMRGQKIIFRAMLSQNEYMDVDVTATWKTNNATYPSFNAYIVDSSRNIIMFAFTGTTSDGDNNTYGTRLYALTPVEPDVNE